MSVFLFELGVEELPPGYVTHYANKFVEFLQTQLEDNSIAVKAEQLKFYAAPRRLGLSIEINEANATQALKADEKKGERIENGVLIAKRMGPKVQALTDKPAVGFAKSCGIEPEQLQQDEQGRVFCDVRIEAKRTIDLLPKMLQTAFEQFNKTVGMRFMHWADRDDLFIRPVKWLVCMHDAEVITMSWLGLESSNTTRGHRFHGAESVVIENASDYDAVMKAQFVVPDYQARRDMILSQLKQIEGEQSAEVIIEEDLLDEVTSINEWPKAVLCNFSKDFLAVPQEALIESMQSHQKSFALKDKSGKLLPHFITIANIESQEPQSLIHGNEKVMTARLSDARFFYETDIKKSLDEMNDKNTTVTFQKKLGTVADKTARMSKLAEKIAERVGAEQSIVTSAAQYANADLRSAMVYEFPELQGIMGKYYYAHHHQDGNAERVAECIEQRYWPRFSDDAVPASKEAACLALADRLDTLIGIFGIGMKPTGSKDPYSLRRAAIGVVRIIQERELTVSLTELLAEAKKTYGAIELQQAVESEVHEYILKRLEDFYIKEYPGDKHALQILRSVQACQQDDLIDLHLRFSALREFKDLPELPQLAESNKRVKNLLKKADCDIPALNKDLLQEADESKLAEVYDKINQQVSSEKDYVNKFKVLCEFAKPLAAFFDNVMVMVDDNALKLNRLSLLKSIYMLFLEIADISFIS